MRKTFLLLAILGMAAACAHATDVSGPVSGTWSPTGNPYNVVGEIVLPANQSLVIQPGVQVIFQGHYKFLVYGMLQAIGTPEDSILITAANPATGFWGLRFFDLNTQPDSSRLVYCNISYGVSSSDNNAGDDKHGGAIFASNSSKLLISHCLIANNRTGDVWGVAGYEGSGGGSVGNPGGPGEGVFSGSGGALYLRNSSASITQNKISFNHTGNNWGGAGGAGQSFFGNYFWVVGGNGGPGGSGYSGDGGAIFVQYCTPMINANEFMLNSCGEGHGGVGGGGGSVLLWGLGDPTGGNGGSGGGGQGGKGGCIYMDNSNATLANNLLYNNSGGQGFGGNGGGGGAGLDENNQGTGGHGGTGANGIGGNGGAFYIDNCSPYCSNSTTNLNAPGTATRGEGGAGGMGTMPSQPGNPGSSQAGLAAITCIGPAMPILVNSIVWDNISPEIIGAPIITYSDISGGYAGEGNINLTPLFVGNVTDDHFLSQVAAGQSVNSPCVDAGFPDSGMVIGTTRTDGLQDSGIVDMGYHYPTFMATPVLGVTPDSLLYTAAFGGLNPPNQIFRISNENSGAFNFEIFENISWLSLSEYSGGPIAPGNPAIITTTVDIAGLSIGMYSGEVIVTAEGVVNSPDTVHVILIIGNSQLSLTPPVLNFQAALGGGTPRGQTFQISNTGLGLFSYTVSENVDWLSVWPAAGGPVPPTAMDSVSVDISGLSLGTYNTDIIVTAFGALNSPDTVHVSLVIGESVLNVQPDTLIFETYQSSSPSSQVFTISNSGLGTLQYTVAENIPWLSVSSLSGPVPPTATDTVTIHPAGLSPGDYFGDIQIVAPLSVGSPDTVHVHLHVSEGYAGQLSGIIPSGVHNMIGNVTVSANDTLLIAPGATLLFQQTYGLNVYGLLKAIGTPSDSIVFKPNTSVPTWGGLRIESTASDSCHLKYCVVKGSNLSGITCNNSYSRIEYSSISDNNYGSWGGIGGGINYSAGSGGLLLRNTISGNTTDWAGGGIFCGLNSTAIIAENIIANNSCVGTAGNGSGGGVYCVGCTPIIYGNIISNNLVPTLPSSSRGGGLSLDSYSSSICRPIIHHNLIYSNQASSGGGIFMGENTVSEVLNNTICQNSAVAPDHLGGGIFFFYIDSSAVSNCIFWGNSTNDLSVFGNSPDINYCDTQDTPWPGVGNISSYPLFSSDYHLTANSPCIDAGDPASPHDPDSTIADMGAFYYDQSVGVLPEKQSILPTSFALDPVHPNPFNPTTVASFELPVSSHVRLTVWDLSGRLVTTLVDGWRQAGVHEVTFDGSGLSSGLYFVKMEAGEFSAVTKMVLLK